MADKYVVLIVFPAIIFIVLAFIFSTQLTGIGNQQYLVNCPLPIPNGIASNFTIVNNHLTYVVTQGNANSTDKGTFFDCYIDPLTNQQGFRNIIKPYGATFAGIAYGQIAFFGDNVYVLLGKIQPAITLLINYANAPAQVTNMVWFTYVDIFLLLLIALGIVLVVRSGA